MCKPKNPIESPFESDTNSIEIWKPKIVWKNVIILFYFHLAGLFGFYHILTASHWLTTIVCVLHCFAMGLGITAGAHRLWTHRAYKAKLPLRLILMVFQTWAVQNCIHEWVRDHRAHHKFTDTAADPHNSKRGFWFSHVGWLCTKKHPEVFRKGGTIDMSDVEADSVVMFQKKYYLPLVITFSALGPFLTTWLILGEAPMTAWNTVLGRTVVAWNITWSLNSISHIWGWKPYDRFHSATDSPIMGAICIGEGWHNYHHVFPWDYKTSELLDYRYNLSNALIDFFARIGWAYDLKTVSHKMILDRVIRTGDGSWTKLTPEQLLEFIKKRQESSENLLWGWEDKDMKLSDKEMCHIINKIC